jgi:prevent-host-death family protein
VGELKARFSEFLRRAQAGEAVIVTDRGRPIARLVPLTGQPAVEGRIADLEGAGLVRAGPRPPLPRDFLTRPRPADAEGRSLSAVLEERAEGW